MKKVMKVGTALLLGATMVGLTGCGHKNIPAGVSVSNGGKVLNIWCWNEEFRSRFNDFYPGVAEVSSDKATTTLKDGTVVKWTINENVNNNYQNKLDEALIAQAKAAADDKIDMFLVEADYALKYVDSDYTLDIQKDIGLTKEELADQYQYTKDIVSVDGVQKGTTWQATPGLFAYRRSIAKAVLGTDDPDKVQEALANWDKFDEVAAKAHDKGYKMLSGFDDSYRTFSNNVSAPWVTGTTVNVDKNIMRWIEQTKAYTDKGYNNKTSLWDDGWASDQGADGDVFGFFYSTWGINFTLLGNAGEKGFGDWAVCYGPAPYYWGGTWLCAAQGTDNADDIKDIMEQLTCNTEIMESMTRDQEIQDYTNTISGMKDIAEDKNFGSDFLGGENHVALFSETAEKIDMSNISPYDQGCNELIQRAMKDYFNGNVDLDTAKQNFETSIKEAYPEITDVAWPT
ncbi:ABC transporter substrate-binding protein [Oribacterium sp. C9]|uniref:ABC transporter substrate-binding protein n=1 Tax=Oribacterium sp. C9 TaxID=1943579 RepID=UPI00098EAA20|nr:ABC transporter substrate-binding protein [Oribacterium sp. C9]OON86871.1 ABC transporter substrate-binding protein [Oribacterium sp. C9]